MSWVEVEMSWVEVDVAGQSLVEMDGGGWRWVHGLVIPIHIQIRDVSRTHSNILVGFLCQNKSTSLSQLFSQKPPSQTPDEVLGKPFTCGRETKGFQKYQRRIQNPFNYSRWSFPQE